MTFMYNDSDDFNTDRALIALLNGRSLEQVVHVRVGSTRSALIAAALCLGAGLVADLGTLIFTQSSAGVLFLILGVAAFVPLRLGSQRPPIDQEVSARRAALTAAAQALTTRTQAG